MPNYVLILEAFRRDLHYRHASFIIRIFKIVTLQSSTC